ncbi:MAG TPA: cytochrome b N-terminal domain-containing protein [Pirellulales bacterium]|jgi:ubiquinol-cytochrome c reductase cytochrome b subunit|nr:cytochrome b N-terminal domain-containing protein [Pirellulales bacterium]
MLPNGPAWTLSSASCLLWLLLVEVVTGFLLMATYSPSTNNAWASINFIQNTPAGSFIRGLHYFAAQAMILLVVLHVVRVILQGAYRAPREFIWMSGLLLLPTVIVWTISGNPLSGALEGFSQINVEGNIIGSTPLVGPIIRQVLIGGDQVGNLTLTHLYFLHVGLIPAVVIVLLTIHITQMYRHGLSTGDFEPHPEKARHYFPYQSARNVLVFSLVLAAIAYFAWTRGAPFGAPADPSLPIDPRPEWYFMWLFELRRYFSGPFEFVATVIIPSGILVFLLALPLLDRAYSHRTSHYIRLCIVLVGVLFVGGLTAQGMWRDWKDAAYQTAKRETDSFGERARELARTHDIPPEGAVVLLRADAKTQGPILFRRHCQACHSVADEHDVGLVASDPSAPNLYGIGSRAWVAGWLDPKSIIGPRYFGHTKFLSGDMVKKIQELFADQAGDKLAALAEKTRAAALALSAESALPRQADADRRDAAAIAAGRKQITGALGCSDCHKFHDDGDLGSAPDLTGYGSAAWLTAFIGNPEHARFYPKDDQGKPLNDRMPAFAPNADHPRSNLLSPEEINLLVHWLRQDWEEAAP